MAMTIVSNGADLQISAGQFSAGIIVLTGGTLQILSGGVASDTVDAGGHDIVSSGGLAIATVISSGGKEDVYGNAPSAHVFSGGGQGNYNGRQAARGNIDGRTRNVWSGAHGTPP